MSAPEVNELKPKRYSSCVGGSVKVRDIICRSDKGVGLVDKLVTVCGWVKTARHQGSKTDGLLTFVELSDGSCMKGVQLVIFESVSGFDQIQKHAATGAAIQCFGKIVKSPKEGQDVEISLSEPNHFVKVLGPVNDTPADHYPMSKKQHTREHLLAVAHLRPRSNLIGAVARVRSSMAAAVHDFFQSLGFLYVHTPIITAADCEGAGELFQVTTLLQQAEKKFENLPIDAKTGKFNYAKDFFTKPAFLTVSGQLNGETYACALSDIYTFGPTFRAENSHTTRHLAEFWMIEPELAFANLTDNMDCIEDFMKHCVKWALEKNIFDIEFFDKFVEKGLKSRLDSLLAGPFARVSYTEAIDILKQHMGEKKVQFENSNIFWGMDLNSEHERYLCEKVYNRPTFVYNYPKDIKAFYMRMNEDGKTVAAVDLLAPGVGEVVGGSQREERLETLDKRIVEMGMHVEDYSWYRDLRKYGSVPHSGFGLGFERLIMYVTGVDNIRDVIPFPRYPGHAEF